MAAAEKQDKERAEDIVAKDKDLKAKDKASKNSESLAEAIKQLTETFMKAGEDAKKGTQNKSIEPGSGSIKDGIKAHFAPMIASIKQLTTKTGVLDMLSAKAGGGLMSSVLSTSSDALKARAEARETKTKWGAAYLAGTDKGRALVIEHGSEKASTMAAQTYDDKLKLEDEIRAEEEQRSTLRKSGIGGADLDKDRLIALAKKKKDHADLIGAKSYDAEAAKRPKAPNKSGIPETTWAPTDDKTDPNGGRPVPESFGAGSKDDIQEELLKLNEEQLTALKELVKNSMKSEEDKFEEDKKGKIASVGEKIMVPPKNSGILSTLLNVAKDALGPAVGVISGLVGTRITATLLPAAAAAAGSLGAGVAATAATSGLAAKAAIAAAPAVAAKAAVGASAGKAAMIGGGLLAAKGALLGASAYAGYKAGGLLNDYVLNPLAGAITGNKNDTLGGAIYTGVDKLKGFFGMKTDQDKINDAEKTPATASKMKSRSISNTKMRIGGIDVVPGKPLTPLQLTLVQTRKDMGNAPDPEIEAHILATSAVKVTKLPEPSAIKTSDAMKKSSEAIDKAKSDAPEAKANSSQNIANTVVNNNSSTIYTARPELRTAEPTFNRILARNFA